MATKQKQRPPWLSWGLSNPYGALGNYWDNAGDIQKFILESYEKWKKKKKK